MPHQTPCPKCGKVGLVRIEHVIKGGGSSRAHYCGSCEHQWDVVDIPAAEPPAQPPLQPRTRRFGPRRSRLQ